MAQWNTSRPVPSFTSLSVTPSPSSHPLERLEPPVAP
jgi:hypothetical protein